MIRALALSTNFRNADNWLPLFQRIRAEGGVCEWLALPWLGDPSMQRMAELEAALPMRLRQPIQQLTPDGLSEAALADLLDKACGEDINVVFLCDMQSYPSNAVHRLLQQQRQHRQRPAVVGLQHGLFQSWWIYNHNFCADHLLAMGDRHVQELDPPLRGRVTPVGLPKLDRLERVPTHDGGYIAFIAQRFLPLTALEAPLAELSAHVGLPIRSWDHPQYPTADSNRPPAPGAEGDPYIRFLAGASWVISGYSTGALEALFLRKDVVLLPSFGLTAWSGFPGVARDASLGEVMSAFWRRHGFPNAMDSFLRETCGGLCFDSTDRAWRALQHLVRDGVIPALPPGRP